MLGFLGFLVMLQGFGSAIAKIFFDRPNFGPLVRWASDYQPAAGLCIGLAGLGLIILGERLSSGRTR